MVVVAVYLLFRSLSSLAGVVLDRWWLDSVTDAPVWSTITWARIQLAFIAGFVTVVLVGGSLLLVHYRGESSIDEVGGLVRRYRRRMGPAHWWVLIAVLVLMTIKIASAANAHWQEWLLFRRGVRLDATAPELGGDLGLYLFKLPLLATISSWIRQILIVALALSAFAAWISGGIRPGRDRRSDPAALAQLGLLAAAFCGAQALDYIYVRRHALAVNQAGSFVGPGFTELVVGLPVQWVLAVVAVLTGLLFVNAVRTNRWSLPVAVLAGWAGLHLVGVIAIPVLLDRFVVAPAEAARQLPYLEHHLDATRQAFGLDLVDESDRVLHDGVSPDATTVDRDGVALGRVPLFDTTQLPGALQVLQGRTATRITDVDLDRYEIDGEIVPVMVAARSSSRNDLPETGWVQEHLVYTHGIGVLAIPADTPDSDGRPDVAALGSLQPERPELYFGEGVDGWYSIVGTKRAEQGDATFDADTGIDLSSTFSRLILALREGEIDPLFSAELTDDSQLLYRRGIRERLEALAPFATFGADPYPVITDDSVVWVVDGYTTSSTHPYSQFVTLAGNEVNYVHASLKATVDAYDGTVHLYRTEVGGGDDPILDAWARIFPGLVEPIDAMPGAIRDHLLYPPELLRIQMDLLGRYHVDDAETLFNGTQRWSPAAGAPASVGAASPGPAAPTPLFVPDPASMDLGWASVVPYSPGASSGSSSARDRLSALAFADHDDGERLTLTSVEAATGEDLATPLVAQSAIDADAEITQLITLLNANGSIVGFGPMTPLVIDDGLVWVRSILVSGTGAATVPHLYGVVAVSNGLVGSGDDVESALADVRQPRG